MHYPQPPGGGGDRSPLDDLKGGFATTAAAMLAMLVAPSLDEITAPYVIYLAQQSYPADAVDLIDIAWTVACYPFVFFAARAGIAGALTVAGMYLAYRFI
ncbi:MAG: hypothetical protein AAF367_18850 [Pseudomonadota bacterium]